MRVALVGFLLLFLITTGAGFYSALKTVRSSSYVEQLLLTNLRARPNISMPGQYRLYYRCPILDEYWSYSISSGTLAKSIDKDVIAAYHESAKVDAIFGLTTDELKFMGFIVTGLELPALYNVVLFPKIKPGLTNRAAHFALLAAGTLSGYFVGEWLGMQLGPSCDTPEIREAIADKSVWQRTSRLFVGIELFSHFKLRLANLERSAAEFGSEDIEEFRDQISQFGLEFQRAFAGYVTETARLPELYNARSRAKNECSTISYAYAFLACALHCQTAKWDAEGACPSELMIYEFKISTTLDWSYYEHRWRIYPPWLGKAWPDFPAEIDPSIGHCYKDRRERFRAVPIEYRDKRHQEVACTKAIVGQELNRESRRQAARCHGKDERFTELQCRESRERIRVLTMWRDSL